MTGDSGAGTPFSSLTPFSPCDGSQRTGIGRVLRWRENGPGAIDKPGGALPAPLLFHRRRSAWLRKESAALMEKWTGGDRPELQQNGFGRITGIHPEPYGR